MSNPNSSTSVVDISVKPQPTTVTSINTRKRRIIFYSCIGIVVAAAIIVGVIFGWYMKRSDRAVRQTVVNQPTSASFYRYNTPANESETAINAFQFDEISGELVWMSASGQFNLVPYSKIDTESGNTYFPTSIIDIVSTNGSSSTVIDMGIISSNPSAKIISSAVMFQDGSVAVFDGVNMSVKSSSALAPVVWGGSSSILNVTLIKGAVLDEFVVESFNNSMLVIRNLTSGKDIMSINSVVPGSFDVNPTRNQFAVSFQNGTIAIFAQNSSFFNDNLFHPIKVNNTGYSDSSIVWCQLSASNSNLMFFLRYYDVNSTFYLERYDFRDAANNHVFPFDASISIDIHATIKLVGDRYLFALSLDGSIYRWDLESWDPSNIHSSAPTDVFTSGFNNYLITPSSRYLIASTKGLILGWELS